MPLLVCALAGCTNLEGRDVPQQVHIKMTLWHVDRGGLLFAGFI